MGRPREHDEETRRRLLEAAAAVLGGDGVHAMSVRRIADDVGTTTRAVYSLFGSKQGLVRTLYRMAFERLDAELAAVRITDDPIADVRALAMAYRAAARSQPNLYALMFASPIPEYTPDRDDYAFARSTLRHLRSTVLRGIDAGALQGDAEVLTLQLWGVVHGVASLELAGVPSPIGFDEIWDGTLEAVLTGMRPTG